MNFIKLVQFEVNRFIKMFGFLFIATFGIQLIGAVISSKIFVNSATEESQQSNITLEQYAQQVNHYNLWDFVYTEWFLLPILFTCTVLCIYVFFIWYRDWLGKASFIYRLMILPTQRINVYLAKLSTILLFVLTLIGTQVIMLLLIDKAIAVIVPAALYESVPHVTIYGYDILQYLYPTSWLQFIKTYVVGITAVAVIFTAILFERSYRLKGIVFAIIYTIVSSLIGFSPYFLDALTNGYFYDNEIFWMNNVMVVLVLLLAIWIAKKLLNEKIEM